MSSSQADNKNHVKVYLSKVKSALDFAGDTHLDGWVGQFYLGMAIAGLELIPYSCDIRPKSYWITAPEPPGEIKEYPLSWIVEYGALNTVGDYDES